MKKNIVPIVFAFDNNIVMPACVCISSLLMNAEEETFYDIYIICSRKDDLDTDKLDVLPDIYRNCRITYKEIGNLFKGAFEIRGVTTPTYYRLILPDIMPEYDKILYADVDILFRMDLRNVYNIDMSGYYLAATYDLGMNLGTSGQKYINSVAGLGGDGYFQAGFVLMNIRAMREDGLTKQFKEMVPGNYRYQDQDILNIVCKGKIKPLPAMYNMTHYSFYYLEKEPEKLIGRYAVADAYVARNMSNLHFNGHKPWKKFSVNFDIWWEYYRKSPVFAPQFYFDFFYDRLNELDQLSLWKRIKIFVRYFVYGKRKI